MRASLELKDHSGDPFFKLAYTQVCIKRSTLLNSSEQRLIETDSLGTLACPCCDGGISDVRSGACVTRWSEGSHETERGKQVMVWALSPHGDGRQSTATAGNMARSREWHPHLSVCLHRMWWYRRIHSLAYRFYRMFVLTLILENSRIILLHLIPHRNSLAAPWWPILVTFTLI